jgi:uncharacterized protein YjbI with pentapeptide repeats
MFPVQNYLGFSLPKFPEVTRNSKAQSRPITLTRKALEGDTVLFKGRPIDVVQMAINEPRREYRDLNAFNAKFEPGFNQYRNAVIIGEATFMNASNVQNGLAGRNNQAPSVDFSGMQFIPVTRPHPWDPERQIETDLCFMNAELVNADFSGSILPKTNFMNAKLTNANFKDAKLPNACFMNAVLDNVDFENADLEGVEFMNADLTTARNLDKANLTGATFGGRVQFPPGFDPYVHGMR